MNDILVIAPHADDESYGCGGTLLRHIKHGDRVHWLLVTTLEAKHGWTVEQEERRKEEIKVVSEFYPFSSVTVLTYPTTQLDRMPIGSIVGDIAKVAKKIQPSIVYVPFPGDAHTDHRVVFDASAPLAKHFRYPFVEEVRVYETPSETDFGFSPVEAPFRPNLFVNISDTLAGKLDAIQLFPHEIGTHPFPRSITQVESLARVRGGAAGFEAAEAFMVLIRRAP